MKKILFKYWPFFLILIVSFIFQYGLFNELPSFIHSWAQADHLAITYGFLENGLDFFHPQTLHYNHQYPDNWHSIQETTITAVDFPINNYIVALLMKLLGTTHAFVFHIVAFCWSLIGFWGLYRLYLLLDQNKIKALFAVLFIACSPLLAYYQISFLPSIPAFTLAIWGIKYYLKYRSTERNKYFIFTMLLMAFSTMIRTTFVIPLIAILSVEFLQIVTKKSKLLPKLPSVLFAFLLIGSYLFYNSILREKYGSIFLSHLMPAHSWADAKEIINDAYNNWRFTYFSKRQYWVYAVLLLFGLYSFVRSKTTVNPQQKALILVTLIYLLGCTLFGIAMLGQFRAHDYYFLDSFFLAVSILFIFLLSIVKWTNNFKWNTAMYSILALVFLLIAGKTIKSQKDKRTPQPWDKTYYSVIHFKEGKELLDQLNSKADDRILLINPCSTNLPFILLERKGYVIMSPNKNTIEGKLEWNYDYVLLQNDYFLEDVYPNYPDIINQLEVVARGKHVSICKFDPSRTPKVIDEFIVLNGKPLFETTLEKSNNPHWKNYNIHLVDGVENIVVPSDQEFSCNLISESTQLTPNQIDKIAIETKITSVSPTNAKIVIDIEEHGDKLFYQTLNLIPKDTNSIKETFKLPPSLPKNAKLSIYIWNQGKSNFNLDFITVKFY